uniref:Uncharacterized protein n=1 Tax=Heterorhabditis bacteriophora TaxID=37862 RepID=A0A1I7WTU4_HETBA
MDDGTGFDTKDTDFSGPRIAWQKLQSILQTSNRIPFSNTRKELEIIFAGNLYQYKISNYKWDTISITVAFSRI